MSATSLPATIAYEEALEALAAAADTLERVAVDVGRIANERLAADSADVIVRLEDLGRLHSFVWAGRQLLTKADQELAQVEDAADPLALAHADNAPSAVSDG